MAPAPPIPDQHAERLLARAALWRWAARAFWYPEPAIAVAWTDPQAQRDLAQAAETAALDVAPGSAVPDAAGEVHPSLHAALDGLTIAVAALDRSDLSLAEEHTALFSRRVAVPPHATVYGADLGSNRTQDLARIASFYEAFGFQVSAARPELADHVCVELEFVAAMLAKEAYAAAQGQRWRGRAARVARALRLFLDEHLRPWFPKFQERLTQQSRLAFYPAAGQLVQALLHLEAPAKPRRAPPP